MFIKRTSAFVAFMFLLASIGAHSAQASEIPPRLALEIQMPGHASLYVPLQAKPKTTLIALPSGETVLLNLRVQPNQRTLRVNLSAPIDRFRALAKGFEKNMDAYASYDLALAPGAREVWVEDLSVFGIQPLAMSVVEDPDPNPVIQCKCGSETCYPKPGQCVDCGCATCCADPVDH